MEIGLGNYELYYKGFSNEVLWPLFHNFSTYCNFLPKYYEAFKKVNRQFANTVIENLTENDFVWVHDYHLINTAKYLREKKINNKIAFFLHIPFPPAETFKRMPWRTEILNALFYYDLIGFQTPWDKQNFLDAIKFLIKDAKIKNENKSVSSIKVGDMKSKAGSFPISMDFNEFSIPSKNTQIDIKTKEIQKQIAFVKKQKALAEEVYASNTVLKESMKNLFDLVPDQITLSRVLMDKDSLIIYGITPSKDTYNFLLGSPLRSIFYSSNTLFYLRDDGWFRFVSVNKSQSKGE